MNERDNAQAINETKNIDMDFSSALQALKNSKRLTCRGWKHEGVFIEMHKRPYVVYNPHPITSSLFLHMQTAEGYFIPWVATQADLLAGDWSVLPYDSPEELLQKRDS